MKAEGKEEICRPLPPENTTPTKFCSLWGFGRNNFGQLGIDSLTIPQKTIPTSLFY